MMPIDVIAEEVKAMNRGQCCVNLGRFHFAGEDIGERLLVLDLASLPT